MFYIQNLTHDCFNGHIKGTEVSHVIACILICLNVYSQLEDHILSTSDSLGFYLFRCYVKCNLV